MTQSEEQAWLPNLARGVSVWNLAADLNRPELFGGRLLVPRVLGPANLPRRVEWNLTDLLPLEDARKTGEAAVEEALEDLADCVERAAPLFAPGGSYAEFAGALTFPPLDQHDCYYYDAENRKILVKNWGARRRAIAQKVAEVIDCAAFPDRVRGRPGARRGAKRAAGATGEGLTSARGGALGG
ncbi:MAG: hypothetical protein K8H88_24430, partial [Sandaracinaceae bacterium]|nr:hypothetical protein [Sandaracinaceae bacterium]